MVEMKSFEPVDYLAHPSPPHMFRVQGSGLVGCNLTGSAMGLSVDPPEKRMCWPRPHTHEHIRTLLQTLVNFGAASWAKGLALRVEGLGVPEYLGYPQKGP